MAGDAAADGVQEVLGRVAKLDDTRLVFVGRRADAPDVVFLGFRNAEGDDTRLTLSAEAWEALRGLCADPRFDQPGESFPASARKPVEFVWRVAVLEAEVEETTKRLRRTIMERAGDAG